MKLRYKIFLLLILLVGGAVLAGSQFEPVKAAARKIVYNLRFEDGLVGYWSFNGADMSGVTATDRGSGANNGTLTGGPTVIPGVVGQALKFDGSNDYVNISTNPMFEVSATVISVSFWANIDASSFTGAVKLIFDDATGNPGVGNGFYVAADDRGSVNGVTATKQLNAVVKTTGGLYHAGADNAFDVGGGWHQYAVTYDGSSMAFYRDGVLLSSEVSSLYSATGDFVPRDDSMAIGAADNATFPVTGFIDEARLYNRVLTAAEIAYQYARTKPAGSGTVAKSVANNNGLVGFWDFDDCDTCTTVTDRSGNGNTGTMYNAAGPTAGDLHTASGKIGRGASFDGSNDYVSVPDSASFAFAGNVVTLAAWIKVDTSGNGTQRAILSQYNGGVAGGLLWYFEVGNNSLTYHDGGSGNVSSNFTFTDGQWHYVTYVSQSLTSHQIYVDGVLDKNDSSSAVVMNSAQAMQIGATLSSSAPSSFFKGQIDEVKIYNRVLTADEIKNLYNSTRKMFVNIPPKDLLTDGLVGYWSFNGPDMRGVTAYDRSGGGNDGTLTNGPVVDEGIVGQGLKFDGDNDRVSISNSSNQVIPADNAAFSVALWFRPASIRTSNVNSLLTNETYTVSGFRLGVNNGAYGADTKLKFWSTESGGSITMLSDTNLDINKWYHAVISYTGSEATMYIDGVQEATDSSGVIVSNTNNIGLALTFGYKNFEGVIDEFRIYNRELSVAEVLKLYNAGKR